MLHWGWVSEWDCESNAEIYFSAAWTSSDRSFDRLWPLGGRVRLAPAPDTRRQIKMLTTDTCFHIESPITQGSVAGLAFRPEKKSLNLCLSGSARIVAKSLQYISSRRHTLSYRPTPLVLTTELGTGLALWRRADFFPLDTWGTATKNPRFRCTFFLL